MEIVVFLFKTIWVVGFLSGLAAAASMFALSRHAVAAPRFLVLSGVSLLFAKYYPHHNKQRKITLALWLVCILSIFLGFLVLFLGVPGFRDLIFQSLGEGSV
ncbi:hypothetical protein MO867_21310 [Microbulbifer sp. OS29]|uniref:Uncharacterized protein n=1 Tax=Microbulbifer okhotskensis TaxID=2926617 RepID=A0A9X2J8H7_9GAMM|nr:hypothetical protein [Microbulbifer okhotskensis]MCO1336870.1 hypothetical protein [Microbulbifer okhotskensis]